MTMGTHRKKQQSISKKVLLRLRATKPYPPPPNNIGRRTKWVSIRGEVRHFTISDEITRYQSSAPNKVICLQKMICANDKSCQFRLGYYMIGVKPRMAGKWVWGQFATILPAKDFRAIIREAEKRGWF